MRNGRRITRMKKRILASLLKGMSGSELYAFLVATILNMSRSYNISTDDIIVAQMI